MASKLDICNQALALVGANQASSVDDPTTEEERACKLWWDTCLDEVLCEVDWRFARKRQALLAATTDPSFGYDHAYQLPSDYLKIRGIYDTDAEEMITDNQSDSTYSYEIENQQMVTDLDEVNLIYTARISATGLYTSRFVKCLVLLLAANMAPKLTSEGKPKRKDFLNEYWEAISDADDNENETGYFLNDKKDQWLAAAGFSEYDQSSDEEDSDVIYVSA